MIFSSLNRYPLLSIILLSVILRLSCSFYLGNDLETLPGVYDQVSYHNLALRVLEGHGFSFDSNWWPATQGGEPTAHWSFLYTLFLAAVYYMFGPNPLAARVIQSTIVAIAHPWLSWRIGRRLFGDRTGLVAAMISAIYAYFVYYAGALMTESFYIIALLFVFDVTTLLAAKSEKKYRRPWPLWIGLGIAVGCSILLRQVFLFFTPFLFAWLWFSYRKRKRGIIAFRGIIVACIVILALILPWTVRNYQVYGKFVLLNTNAGFAFFWGNHPVHGTDFIPILEGEQSYGSLIPERLHGLNEANMENEMLREGIGFVRKDPARYLMLSLSRFKEYFRFWPSRESSVAADLGRLFSFGIFLPFMIAGIILTFSHRASRRCPAECDQEARMANVLLLLFICSYTFIHLLTWTLIRYRLPIDSVLTIYAGYSICLVYELFHINRLPSYEKI